MQKFDWVFDGDDVLRSRGVHTIDHGSKSRRLSRTGNAGDQDKAARLFADLLNDLRQVKLFQHANLRGNYAQNQADITALLKDVYTEATESGHTVGHIEFRSLFEFLLLPV